MKVFKKLKQLKGKRCMGSDIFDSEAVKAHKIFSATHGSHFDYLKDEISQNVIERLDFINKKFPTALEFYSGDGYLYKNLPQTQNGIENYIMTDSNMKTLTYNTENEKLRKVHKVAFTEDLVPFKENSIDVCIAANGLHFINDLEKFFVNTNKILKPDGAFVGALLGGDSLYELRSSFLFAEQEREGGVSAHIHPTVNLRDTGNLLSSAGFALPTVDSDTFTVYYPNAFVLMNHLQLMGENSSLFSRRTLLSKETFLATAAIYEKMYGDDKGIPATFEIIYFIAWKPDPSQPKPAKRGSGKISMKTLASDLKTDLFSIEEEKEEKTK